MANRWLVQNLINNAKRRGRIVESDDATEGFTTADFLALIDEVIRSRMVPLLKKARENYLQKSFAVELTAGIDTYAIPGRAAAEALHSILQSSDGVRWLPLERTEVDHAHAFVGGLSERPAYYLEDDSVVFVPTPSAQTVRFVILNRPNMVVEASEVGQVSAINTDTQAVTFLAWDEDDEDFTSSAPPSTFSSSILYDLVKGTPGFRNRGIDLSATLAGNILTFEDELPDLAVGDFVCRAGETPIAQIPAELQPMLAEEVTRVLLVAKKDVAGANLSAQSVAQMEKDAIDMLSPRVSAAPRYIQNYNLPGWNKGRWGGHS